MPTELRAYQKELKASILAAWGGGERNVLGVMPTGAGKTSTFSDIILNTDAPSCAIAHRQELVGQISLALARNGVRHRIIGPNAVVKRCVTLHMEKLGKSYFDPNAWSAVAGVDTLIRRGDELKAWLPKVKLWVQDEAHHVVRGNKWGTAAEMFANALGLGVTATPGRADGRGLGRHADGVFDAMVEGPTMRELIDMGYLTDYRIFAPPSDYHRPSVLGKDGDFTNAGMRDAAKKSQIVGDVAAHYLKLTPGQLGVTFAPDLETAAEIAAQFNASGVPAAVVSGKTPDDERASLIRQLENRQLLQLVNVDLFGEGFDLPAIQVVSFARPTESLSLYIQQFGRVLRLFLGAELYAVWEQLSPSQRLEFIRASDKPWGTVIDHVGNVARFGLPDAVRDWTLDRHEKRASSNREGVIPTWACPQCSAVTERIYKTCVACGAGMPPPSVRSGPEFVDGDLIELDATTLAQMRGERAMRDLNPEAFRAHLAQKHVPTIGQLAQVKRHVADQAAQAGLRESLEWWGGLQRAYGRDDSESYRRFYYTFGIDVLSAQALREKDAIALKQRVDAHLDGVIRA